MHEFASQMYMAEQVQGDSISPVFKPRGFQDFVNHSDFDAGLPVKGTSRQIQLRTNTLAARYFAIKCGAATGCLPNFARFCDPSLVALRDDGPECQEIFLTYRRELVEKRSFGIVIEWIKSSINPRAFPWFSSDRIHPNRLQAAADDIN